MIVGALTFFPALSLGPYRRILPHAQRSCNHDYMEENPQMSNYTGKALEMLFCTSEVQFKNPVMFVTYLGAIFTTIYIYRRRIFYHPFGLTSRLPSGYGLLSCLPISLKALLK